MVYDIYSARIGAAQRNIAVLTRILDGTHDGADLFDLGVLLRTEHSMRHAERVMFIDRVRTHTTSDDDKNELQALMYRENCNLAYAAERHRQDVTLGVKY